jgi:hypothetical protein
MVFFIVSSAQNPEALDTKSRFSSKPVIKIRGKVRDRLKEGDKTSLTDAKKPAKRAYLAQQGCD